MKPLTIILIILSIGMAGTGAYLYSRHQRSQK